MKNIQEFELFNKFVDRVIEIYPHVKSLDQNYLDSLLSKLDLKDFLDEIQESTKCRIIYLLYPYVRLCFFY